MPPTCRCPTCEKKSEVRSENHSGEEETYLILDGETPWFKRYSTASMPVLPFPITTNSS